ncbi:MAG: formylmethanofuran dehydrogenase subunit E family protein [candidate division WOR-3 bacterium]|nr:formylmethanofuran dehydrogenase subunit E family protein [candidate division WOR-3 bacterium]
MFNKILVVTLSILFFAFVVCIGYDGKENNMVQNEELLSQAVKFHGHLGPYLVLGLRAGLFANQVLEKDPMKTEAIIETLPEPPESCFVDGVQFTTGCTMGKRNISLVEGEGLKATFKKDKKILTLTLKQEVIDEINSLPPDEEEAWENLARDLYQREIERIFEISK